MWPALANDVEPVAGSMRSTRHVTNMWTGICGWSRSLTLRRTSPGDAPDSAVARSNACVLGAIQIGEGARIGSGRVVISDVPENATVVGVPGRIVRGKTAHDVLDHAALPDPVMDVLRTLAAQQEGLLERLAKLERKGRNGDEAEHHEQHDDPRARAGRIF